FVTSQGSADDAGQEGPLEGADAGLWQKDRNGFNFLAEISISFPPRLLVVTRVSGASRHGNQFLVSSHYPKPSSSRLKAGMTRRLFFASLVCGVL
ncbi:MAG: hypothetical protein FWE42_04355, partial [Defluviitaleaceae bacterium]|nr:hypothetical protein [Defluviitaleaceae bacterium]